MMATTSWMHPTPNQMHSAQQPHLRKADHVHQRPNHVRGAAQHVGGGPVEGQLPAAQRGLVQQLQGLGRECGQEVASWGRL